MHCYVRELADFRRSAQHGVGLGRRRERAHCQKVQDLRLLLAFFRYTFRIVTSLVGFDDVESIAADAGTATLFPRFYLVLILIFGFMVIRIYVSAFHFCFISLCDTRLLFCILMLV